MDDKNNPIELPTIVVNAMYMLSAFCDGHPTCDGCPFRIDKKRCFFRGKTPREYTTDTIE
jgi:hypothetical protein